MLRSALLLSSDFVQEGSDYLRVGMEERADRTVRLKCSHCRIEGLLCQEVGGLVLPQMLLLLHVTFQWYDGGQL